jgi:molybdopterin-guanine dinucleotide biosynthesis protein B
MTTAPVIGIAGWKNSGKTTLAVRLVEELTGRGYRVATIKHAHHDLRLDEEGTDSARHRAAGAAQVAVVSSKRWAIMSEGLEPDFAEILDRLDTSDVVIVEGYKSQPIRKIETRRKDAKPGFQLAGNDPNVIAVATDEPDMESVHVPQFHLDAVEDIADFVVSQLALVKGKGLV